MPRSAKIEDDPGSEEAKPMPTPKTGVYAVIALLKRHRVAKRQRRNDEGSPNAPMTNELVVSVIRASSFFRHSVLRHSDFALRTCLWAVLTES
jgi:hypothetical protein